MATFRDNPYGAFNFIVALGGAQGDGGEGSIIGGFSDAVFDLLSLFANGELQADHWVGEIDKVAI